jgi:hypothetical protein
VRGWITAESHAEISVTLFFFNVSNTPRHAGELVTGLSQTYRKASNFFFKAMTILTTAFSPQANVTEV